jgi:hypothetical protein
MGIAIVNFNAFWNLCISAFQHIEIGCAEKGSNIERIKEIRSFKAKKEHFLNFKIRIKKKLKF